jgi:short-subunit dehydrogenase
MRDRGDGHIVNTASMAGLTASPRLGAYTAAKFAVVGLSEVLAAELGPYGVGVSVLCPGLVETRLRETTLASGHDVITLREGTGAPRGIDAAIVGDLVVGAIRTRQLYIVTHGEYRQAVADRMAAVVAAFDDVPHRTTGPRPEQTIGGS